MAAWSLTKNSMQILIEAKILAIRRRVVTANERTVIFAAINEAIIDLSLERGLGAPKVITTDTTATTVAGQHYVDLDSGVLKVVDRTVRIIAQDFILRRFEGGISSFYRFDPGEDISSAFPTWYAMDTDGSGTMRMLLRATPNAVHTINLKVESIPAEDSISTFPGWYHPALLSKAKVLSLEGLGLDGRVDQARYQDRIKDVREEMRGHDGPVHLQMREQGVPWRSPQSRANLS